MLCLLLATTVPLFAAENFKVGAFTFTVPEGWSKVQPSSPMRNAQLEVARGQEKAEVTFFHFGGGSGSPEDNVKRWFGQFPGSDEKQKSETVEAGPVTITFASTEGTFSSGMPGGPTTPVPGTGLYGAIMQHSTGDVYVKMTGPATLVAQEKEALRKMVLESARSGLPQS